MKVPTQKVCPICQRSFAKPPKYSRSQWALTNFCSRGCRNISFKGKHLSLASEFKPGHRGHFSWLGKKLSPQHIAKMRAHHNPARYWLGRAFTEEHKLKLSAAKLGKRPWNWKGLDVSTATKIRTSTFYNKWRRSIFERDKFTCSLCPQRGRVLNVDHYPKTFSFLLAENDINSLDDAIKCNALWDPENARTLCEDCHRTTTSYGSRAIGYNKILAYASN